MGQLLMRIDRRQKYAFVGEIVLKNNARLQARIYGAQNVVLSQRTFGSSGKDWNSFGDDESEVGESEIDDEPSNLHSGEKAARLTSSDVVHEIVRNDPTGTLCADDVIVHFKNVHHGKGIKNPNDYVYFFEKQRPWEGPTSAKPAPDNLARTIDSRKYNLP